MITEYKGVDLAEAPHIKNYIDTYYFINKKDCIECLDKDKTLQQLVNAYHIKKNSFTIIFNAIPYLIVLLSILAYKALK